MAEGGPSIPVDWIKSLVWRLPIMIDIWRRLKPPKHCDYNNNQDNDTRPRTLVNKDTFSSQKIRPEYKHDAKRKKNMEFENNLC